MTNFTMSNNISSMIYALKSVPGVPDAGDPHGDGAVAPAPGSGSKKPLNQVDQHEKLKGWVA